MSEYKLELKQIVDYPRCRIYRQFVRQLMTDRSIRVGGSCCSTMFQISDVMVDKEKLHWH